jgi:hypothetical protein
VVVTPATAGALHRRDRRAVIIIVWMAIAAGTFALTEVVVYVVRLLGC